MISPAVPIEPIESSHKAVFDSRGTTRILTRHPPVAPTLSGLRICFGTKGNFVKRFFVFAALVLVAAFVRTVAVSAATFTNLYEFSQDNFSPPPDNQSTNSDGLTPDNIVIAGNTIYGTCFSGGQYGYGSIFRVNTDGTQFTNLFSFNRGTNDLVHGTYPNNTGVNPVPGLVLISNTLYGATFAGGPNLAGSIFKINTDGSGFATLHNFNVTDGQSLQHGLTLSSNLLYGTTVLGGSNGYGNIFSIDTSGGISFLYQFTNLVEAYGGLVITNDNIYGFGRFGQNTQGLVYRLGPGGYSILYTFSGVDGSRPESTPTLSGNTLFGATFQGGTNGAGNIFRIDLDGSNYTNLYSFTPSGGANMDGSNPYEFTGFILSGNRLYGTASGGGSGGQGTVYQLNTDGSGFRVLHSFGYVDGSNPEPLALSNGTLYGGTWYGFRGSSLGNGTVFAIVLQPTLYINIITNRAVLTWSDASFSLYTSTNVSGTYTNIIGAHSPYTNLVNSPQRFFRLQSN